MGGTSTQLFEVDPASGASSALGNVGAHAAGDLAFCGGELYLASLVAQLVRIDLGPPASGVNVGAFGFFDVYGLATSDDGVLYGVAGTEIFSVDPATGTGTFAQRLLRPGARRGLRLELRRRVLPGVPARAGARAAWPSRARSSPSRARRAGARSSRSSCSGSPTRRRLRLRRPGQRRHPLRGLPLRRRRATSPGASASRGPATLCGPKQKPCWKAKGENGWLYKNPDAYAVRRPDDGCSARGPPGKGRLAVKAGNQAKKLQTALPASIGPALAGEASVKVQVTSSDAQCLRVHPRDDQEGRAHALQGHGALSERRSATRRSAGLGCHPASSVVRCTSRPEAVAALIVEAARGAAAPSP